MISGPDKRIEFLSPVYVGSTHDYTIFKEEDFKEVLLPKTPIYIDTGFEGINNLCPDLEVRKPKKKRKGKKLNGGEKLGNRMISSERVKVEHAIGGMKKFRIAADKFRGITQSMDEVFKVASGLWNLQIQSRSLNHC